MQKMYRLLSVLKLAVCATRRPQIFRELSGCKCTATSRVAVANSPCGWFWKVLNVTLNYCECDCGHFSVQLLSFKV